MPVLTLCLLAALAIGVAACGDNGGGGITSVGEADSGKTIDASVGDTIEVTLDENPSTGYQWEMTASAGLKQTSTEYQGPTESPAQPGAGGVHVWKYSVDQAGTQTIGGVYRGPGTDAETGGEFKLTIDAK
jgi:inhibitor of cysteine peptidase